MWTNPCRPRRSSLEFWNVAFKTIVRTDVRTWPPRSYVAITRTSPGVSLGYSRVREEASFHVVYGSW